MLEPTDIELMLKTQQGDMDAFQQLVFRYRAPLRRFFSAILADRSQADDYVQETFLRLWLTRERYEPTGKFASYLFQIGKHYWLNQRKKFQPQVTEIVEEGALCIPAPSCDEPESAAMESARWQALQEAIQTLPEHYRRVFELCHLEGLPYAEIAVRLAIPVGTVKSRMSEAVRRLRQALTAEKEER